MLIRQVAFSPMEQRLNRILDRKGWDEAKWNSLADAEQIRWIAHDMKRQEKLNDILAQLSKKKDDSDYNSLSAESYVALLLAQL